MRIRRHEVFSFDGTIGPWYFFTRNGAESFKWDMNLLCMKYDLSLRFGYRQWRGRETWVAI